MYTSKYVVDTVSGVFFFALGVLALELAPRGGDKKNQPAGPNRRTQDRQSTGISQILYLRQSSRPPSHGRSGRKGALRFAKETTYTFGGSGNKKRQGSRHLPCIPCFFILDGISNNNKKRAEEVNPQSLLHSQQQPRAQSAPPHLTPSPVGRIGVVITPRKYAHALTNTIGVMRIP